MDEITLFSSELDRIKENPRTSLLSGIFALVMIAVFVAIFIAIKVFHIILVDTITTVVFFLMLISLIIYFWFKGAKGFAFIRMHPYVTFFLLIGIAFSSTQTGLVGFIWNGPYTIGNFVHVLLQTILISQTAQAAGISGGFAIFDFLFGFILMITLLLFFFDLVSLVIHSSLAHSVFPLRVEVNVGLTLFTVIFLSFIIYTSLIWAASAASTQGLTLDPLFGTVSFVSAAIQGQVSLSGLTTLATTG